MIYRRTSSAEFFIFWFITFRPGKIGRFISVVGTPGGETEAKGKIKKEGKEDAFSNRCLIIMYI